MQSHGTHTRGNWSRARSLGGGVALALSACQAARVVTNQCETVFVSGSASFTVSASGSSRQFTLTGEGGRNGSDRFDIVRAALIGGATVPDTGITWALASTDGAQVVVTHRTQLSAGERLTVAGPPGRRDWGIGPSPQSGAALVALVLPNASVGNVTGTIEVLRTSPLELRIELRSPDGSTTFSGTARFQRATEERPCFS